MKAADSTVELKPHQPYIQTESVQLSNEQVNKAVGIKSNQKKTVVFEEQLNPLSSDIHTRKDIDDENYYSTDEDEADSDDTTTIRLTETKLSEEEVSGSNHSQEDTNLEVEVTSSTPTTTQIPTIMPRLTKMKIGLAVLVITTILIIVYYAADNIPFHLVEDACDWIKRNMLIGALLFIPVEIIWTILCIPTTPIELAAGYAFGFGYGFLVDCIAKLIGAALSFFLGRYCLRKCATDDMFGGEKGKLFAAIDAALTNNTKDSESDSSISNTENSLESFKLLLLIQLAYIPVSIKNYGLSFTSVSFSHFIASALIGETPGTLAVTWTGSTTRDLVGLMSGEKSSSQTQVIVLILGLCCLVLCMVVLGVRIKKKLDQTLNAEPYTPLPR